MWGLGFLVMMLAGAGAAPVTIPIEAEGLGRKLHPAFSPDGRRVAFGGQVNGNWEVHVVRTDGSDLRRLTSDPGVDGDPLWSADGRSLDFYRSDATGRFRLRTINVDGTNDRPMVASGQTGFRAARSPDGTKIAFDDPARVEPQYATHQIFVMNADGSNVTRLTETVAYEAAPSWSPDGRRLTFYSQRGDASRNVQTARSEIFVMTADGSGERPVTALGARSTYPRWSPCSGWIAFESDVGGDYDVYVVKADGGAAPVRLIDGPGDQRNPSWSADGRRIVYAHEADGRSELRIIDTPQAQRC